MLRPNEGMTQRQRKRAPTKEIDWGKNGRCSGLTERESMNMWLGGKRE